MIAIRVLHHPGVDSAMLDGWRWRVLLAGAVASLFGGSAGAADAPGGDPDPGFAACSAPAVPTIAIEDCQKTAIARADVALNAAYGRAVATLAPDQQVKLKLAERSWIRFRDQDCDVPYGSTTGTMAGIEAGNCLLARTRTRTGELVVLATP